MLRLPNSRNRTLAVVVPADLRVIEIIIHLPFSAQLSSLQRPRPLLNESIELLTTLAFTDRPADVHK